MGISPKMTAFAAAVAMMGNVATAQDVEFWDEDSHPDLYYNNAPIIDIPQQKPLIDRRKNIPTAFKLFFDCSVKALGLKSPEELASEALEELAPEAPEGLTPEALEELAPESLEEMTPEALEELALGVLEELALESLEELASEAALEELVSEAPEYMSVIPDYTSIFAKMVSDNRLDVEIARTSIVPGEFSEEVKLTDGFNTYRMLSKRPHIIAATISTVIDENATPDYTSDDAADVTITITHGDYENKNWADSELIISQKFNIQGSQVEFSELKQTGEGVLIQDDGSIKRKVEEPEDTAVYRNYEYIAFDAHRYIKRNFLECWRATVKNEPPYPDMPPSEGQILPYTKGTTSLEYTIKYD